MVGRTDTVPAMLTPGEFVIKQESAAMLGEPLLRKLNAVSDNAPQGYQVGGGVSENSKPHGEIDALIGQARANMKPMSGGILSMPFSLLANILNKPVPRTSTVLSPEEQILMELESGTRFPKTDVPSPEEEILNELISGTEQSEKDRPISSPFKGYREGGDVGEYATREKPGRYQDPIHKYISDMILAGKQDSLGGLIDDDYYKPLIEQELRFMNLQNLIQSAEDAIPSYSGKKEGIDLGDIFGEQSWLKQRGKKKSIRNVEDIMGETLFGQRINELYANNLYGLDNNTKGYSNGGGVGEAGRQYPPGTIMSPFMGDKAPIPEAWMQPATESMPSPEEVAEFDRMIKTLQAQELMRKMKEMQEAGMFNEAEEIKFEENIKFDEKSILPPPRVKKDFKNNLYEGFFLPKL